MIVDLHGHYAMHLMDELDEDPFVVLRWAITDSKSPIPFPEEPGLELSEAEKNLYRRHRCTRRRRAVLLSWVRWINMIFNYHSFTSGPGVTLERMKKGRVGVVLSPLIDPLNEFGALPKWLIIMAVLVVLFVLTLLAPYFLIVTVTPVALSTGNWAAVAKIVTYALWMLCVAGGAATIILLLFGALAFHNWRASSSGKSWDEFPGSPPRDEYMYDLLDQRTKVEQSLMDVGDWAVVAHDCEQLKNAINDKKIAIIHCVEGGLQLGSEEKIEDNVRLLAKGGVAYVTLAHLFWRRVATNAPAFPFLADRLYQVLFRQPKQGLTSLGKATVTALFRNGVLIDVTHMNEQAIKETLDLLEELEDDSRCPAVPVLASHIACRFGDYKYNLSNDTIERIGGRNGVMGVIFCDHWMHDGPRRYDPRTKWQTFRIVRENIDRIEMVTKSKHHCAAIGSDLDGFIKPMLRGLEHMGDMRYLEDWLRTQYDEETAELILNGNARRVLESAWRNRISEGGIAAT